MFQLGFARKQTTSEEIEGEGGESEVVLEDTLDTSELEAMLAIDNEQVRFDQVVQVFKLCGFNSLT